MKITILVSAVAALALTTSGARAQTIPTNGIAGEFDGDIILGFTNPTTPPSSGDLVFDIGPADNYYSTTNTTGSPGGGPLTPGMTYTVAAFSASDVTTLFGSGAFSNANVLWGVIGGNGVAGGPGNEPTKTLWAATPGSAALNPSSAQSTTSIAIDGFTDAQVGGGTALMDGILAATYVPFSTGFDHQATAAGNFALFPSSILSPLSASSTTTMTLYELVYGSGSTIDLGTFSLTSSGLTFTAFSAIPEPSMYAAILGALTMGFVLVRRRLRPAAL